MSKLRFGIIVFPGSNCDHDAEAVCNALPNAEAHLIWHKETDLRQSDVIILPGGFSYGDYLRTGAIARFSPVMREVTKFANDGRPVLGICNGFQILCEAGLLDGALMRNANRKFICKSVTLKVKNNETIFTSEYEKNAVVRIPIAHGEGNFVADPDTLTRLKDNGQIVFTYCDAHGNETPDSNPNGSLENIAGICNKSKNVMGLMPHPERAAEALLGSCDGKKLFLSLVRSFMLQTH